MSKSKPKGRVVKAFDVTVTPTMYMLLKYALDKPKRAPRRGKGAKS